MAVSPRAAPHARSQQRLEALVRRIGVTPIAFIGGGFSVCGERESVCERVEERRRARSRAPHRAPILTSGPRRIERDETLRVELEQTRPERERYGHGVAAPRRG